ncbi:MAG: hypothetical protein LAP61_24925 [Acidobacteriia bacterium]|nr:hypothetical protein [Terriglobia bacterium]
MNDQIADGDDLLAVVLKHKTRSKLIRRELGPLPDGQRRDPSPTLLDLRSYLRSEFLVALQEHGTLLFTELSVDVFSGAASVAEWAEKFHIANTWLPAYALERLNFWHQYEEAPRLLTSALNLAEREPVRITIDLDLAPWWNMEFLNKFVLDKVHAEMKGRGLILEAPSDCLRKIECTALYVGNLNSRKDLAERYQRTEGAISSWLDAILNPLEIKKRPQGRPPNKG